jgi:hypothetical protein
VEEMTPNNKLREAIIKVIEKVKFSCMAEMIAGKKFTMLEISGKEADAIIERIIPTREEILKVLNESFDSNDASAAILELLERG